MSKTEWKLEPAVVDKQALAYEALEKQVHDAAEKLEIKRRELIDLAECYGVAVPKSTQSFRLEGLTHNIIITHGTSSTANETAIVKLKNFCIKLGYSALFAKMFTESAKYKQNKAARAAVVESSLPTRVKTRMLTMLDVCYKTATKAPSVSVKSLIEEKPAKLPRGKKVA